MNHIKFITSVAIGFILVFVFVLTSAAQPFIQQQPPKSKVAVGAQAPRFEISKWMNKELEGKNPTKGKVMLLEFWATWCGPCRQTIPHLNALVDKFSKDILFISITSEKADVVKKFVDKTEMKSYVGLDNNGISQKNYDIQYFPNAFLVNKSGKIVWIGHPANLTEKDLEDFISKGIAPKNS